MAHILTDAALGAAPLATHCAFDARARALLTAVTSLLPLLEIGRPVESACLREAMNRLRAQACWRFRPNWLVHSSC